MTLNFKKITAVFALILFGTLLTATANADCGSWKLKQGTPHPASWNASQSPSLLLVNDSDDPIVGMWHVVFTAEGNTGSMAPPDGAPIDNSMVVWHADGTEIMNSSRPPQDGDFCMGVWKRTGESTYKLNHIAWAGNDTTNAPSGIGNPLGATQIAEQVRLSRDCNHYSGRFTLDAYDPSGNNVVHIVGVITATRVTVNTPASSLF